MKALVVGGKGFIGSHVATRLRQEGWGVAVVDKQSGMDMADPKLKDFLVEERADVVFDFAGPLQLRHSDLHSSFEILISLLQGTRNLLDAARATGIKKFLFSSSGAVYGNTTEIPTRESCSLQPLGMYGVATLLFENLLELFEKETGIPVVILRLSNVYGFGQWKNGVQRFTDAFSQGETPEITGDGASTRDYVHIDDVAEAFFAAANSSVSGIFNIGTGKETSLNELFRVVAREFEWEGQPLYHGQADQTERSALDPRKAKDVFGWEPKVSFEEGIQKTVKAVK